MTDLGFPKGDAKLGASIVGVKKCGSWLIQLVVQSHEGHTLSRASGGMPSQEV